MQPLAREQIKQVVTNRVSQFFTVDTYKVEGKDPLVVRFLGEDNLCWKDGDRKKTLPVSTDSPLRGKNSAEPVRFGGKLG